MTIANVALTNTFDQWRIVTNQMVTLLNDIDSSANLVRAQSNTTPLAVTSSVSRGGTFYFDLSTNSFFTNTSTNVLATSNAVNKLYNETISIGISGNTYANVVGISGNTYANNVGTAGNAYAVVVGSASNTYADSIISGNLSAAKSYSDTVVTANLALAKSYSDTVVTANLATAKSYSDTVVTANLALAKSYSDTVVTANLATAKSYSDTVVVANLAIANAYSRVFANSVGTAANNFAGTMANSSNVIAIAAFDKANTGSSSTVTNETTTDATYYPIITTSTTGSATLNVSSTKLTYNPSTGALSATEFNSTSDSALKTDIQPITNALEIITAIDGVGFRWKDSGKPSFGVIAQQLEEHIPALVDNSNNSKTVNYDGIIAFLIEAIKELNAKLENK